MQNKYIPRGVRLEDSNFWHETDFIDINATLNKNNKSICRVFVDSLLNVTINKITIFFNYVKFC